MTSARDENKALVREYLDAFNDRDHERMREMLADDVVEHGAHEELRGTDEIIDFLEAHFETFPDYSGTAEDIIAEDDLVTVRYSVYGTHTGEYRDVEPTGHKTSWSGTAIYRIEDDKIAEIWVEEDRLGMLEQLEAVGPQEAHFRV
ncbi:MAG: ester cyclase [Halobellus sp.]|uniref:ester cyclase n=1 Tax=Halobellus sp. TaxID=1979212 RepID=UPI0035D516CF